MPACTTSGPEIRYNVALAQRKERCVTDERGCAPSIHSRMQAFSFRKRTRLPSYQIPPLTWMNSASDQKRQNSQLSNKQLGSGSRSCSQSRFECLLLTANASPVPEWPSSSSCPPARAPGGCSHTQRKIGNHITRRKHKALQGVFTHSTPLPGERPASFIRGDNSNPLPKPGETPRCYCIHNKEIISNVTRNRKLHVYWTQNDHII